MRKAKVNNHPAPERFRISVLVISLILTSTFLNVCVAEIKLPAVISDNMVLQQGESVPIWGFADAGDKVTVALAGQEKTTTACDAGKWKVTLDALKTNAEPATMTITSGDQVIKLENILVGEVWICSGQSNMEWSVAACNAPDDIAAADFPLIRQIKVPHIAKPTPAMDLRTMAISRLVLDNFDHLKAYWIMLGIGTAQAALAYGADDIDGTVRHELIYHDAGATTPEVLSVEHIQRLIREAGREPVERDTLYHRVVRDGTTWHAAEPLTAR